MKSGVHIASILLLWLVFSTAGFGGTINIGLVSFDVLSPGGAGTPGVNVFNIVNFTGDPASGGFALPPDFPVLTPITFLGSSFATISIGNIGPGPLSPPSALQFPDTTLFTSALFSGTLSGTSFLLSDGTTFVAGSTAISASILPSSGPSLTAGTDFAIISVTGSVSSVPEPGTLTLCALSLLGLALYSRRNWSTRLGLIAATAIGCSAQTQVNLSPATAPGAGQAGVTSVNITGSGFPAGTILPADTDVKLEPAASGAAVTTKATAVTTIAGTTRRVTFLIPASISVANPAGYLISVSGATTTGVQFASSNKAQLTINGGAAILSVNPNSGVAGQTAVVTISGLSTNFVPGATQASFGAGIAVGGAAEGAFGPVTVNGDTGATAQLKIGVSAAAGLRDMTIQTGSQRATLTDGFNVTGLASGTITSLLAAPNSIPLGTPTTLTTTATVTGGTPDSVILQRLDSSGRVAATLGTLHDDGLNGDAKANDGVFTLQSTFTEFAAGPISLRVSATFGGAANPALSPVATLTVIGTPPPTVTFTAPANLSYLNLSPTTVNGTVSDPGATVIINGISAPVASGHFSATIPLAEGPNILTATATGSGGTGTASITVTLDTTPPHVTITSPPDQFMTTDASISVAGNVNDTVVGTVNDQQAQVTINGTSAQVANRTFLASSIPLNLGPNTIQAVARDRAGNAATTQITVTRQTPSQSSRITLISGNNQTASIGSILASPLVVTLTDGSGNPVANKAVIVKVTQNNGMVSAGGAPAPSVMATTDAQGRAQVQWTLGARSGAGSNTVEAYSVGFDGTAIFTATGTQGAPGIIVIDSGNNQTGAVNQPAPKPLIAVVVDSGSNRLSNVPVTFTVKQGGGSFNGQPAVTLTTDSDGRAAATLTLGFQEGNSNNLVEANFPSNQGFPASFTASGRAQGDPAKTTISGVVLDNSNVPIPGVSIRAVLTNTLNSNSGSVQSAGLAQTDAKGQFTITQAPVGFVKLLVDGSTATLPGPYPTLDYDLVTVAGQNNTVGQPIFLLAIKSNNSVCVTATTGGGTLTIPEAPGFSLTFGPGQVTFPGGSKTGCVSVTVVHPDKVPMTPGFGQQPRFIVTIQPSGTLFSPPAPISLPNVDGLAARAVTEMYSFDHDIGSFVAIGTGVVSDDGQVIRSSQGVGVLKAGWHCGGNPSKAGAAATCGPCATCDGNNCVAKAVQGGTCQNACLIGGSGTCTAGHCTGLFQPAGTPCGNAGKCDGKGTCTFGGGGGGGGCPGGCNSGNPCIDDTCGASGQCVATANILCQQACNGSTSGSCMVGNLTGTCDASGNCDLCPSLGTGASCTCGGGALGTCDSSGKCSCTPSVTIDQVWSDQLPGVAVNFIPFGAGAAAICPPNVAMPECLYMGTRVDGRAYVQARLTIFPRSAAPDVYVAVATDRNLSPSAQASGAGGTASVNFDPDQFNSLDPPALYLFAGVDTNKNGRLDSNEILSQSSSAVIAVPRHRATEDAAVLGVGAFLFQPIYPVASSFLSAFINDTAVSGATATDVDIDPTYSTLDIRVGLLFRPTDLKGSVRLNRFPPMSTVTQKALASDEFVSAVKNTLGKKAKSDACRLQPGVSTLSNYPIVTGVDRTGSDITGISFGTGDLLRAIGSANVNATIKPTINRTPTGFAFLGGMLTGEIFDLYDFGPTFAVPGIDARPAYVQANYIQPGDPGHVFLVSLDISGFYTTNISEISCP